MSTKPMIAMPPSLTDEGSNIGTQSSVQYHLSTNYFQDTLNTQFLQKSIELGNNMVENDFLNTQCYSNPSQSQFDNQQSNSDLIQEIKDQLSYTLREFSTKVAEKQIMIDLKKKEIENKKLELFENRQKFQAFLVEEPKIANKMDVIKNNLMANNWLAKHLERNVDKHQTCKKFK
ncbi:hypothetical protein BLOT_012858 [Blomia tropicalis]|nr:hypothetical protein BLOT_012858 [Blomia tropicalis]